MAENFDLHANGKRGQRTPGRHVIPFDSGRRGRDYFRPIDSDKAEPEVSRPGPRPRSLAAAGPLFLLAIAISCGLYAGITYKKSSATLNLQAAPTSQPSLSRLPLSKPSPNPPAVIARAEGGIMPEKTSNAPSKLSGSSTPHYYPIRFEATHKKAFGGCTGQLELTTDRLHFRCPNEADLDIPVGSIAKAHKDGVVLASGEKYHFLIANHTKSQVEAIFTLWLNRVQHFQQLSRKSSF